MAGHVPVAIFIITLNEEKNLPFALDSVREWAQEVFVLDSGSTDRTREVAESMGANFFHREWDGYVNQKNWGLDNLPITAPWVFILDADEMITPELRASISGIATQSDCPHSAYYVNRYLMFLGKRIKHCGYYPYWNVRFFRHGKARYEKRAVHEQMMVEGTTGRLSGEMEHWDRRGLEHYIAKHNIYSTLEAREMFNLLTGRTTAARGSLRGDASMRRRWIKSNVWPRLPARPLVRWIYMYILRLGFLDGMIGFQFCLFLAAYEHQIALKLREMMLEASSSAPGRPLPIAAAPVKPEFPPLDLKKNEAVAVVSDNGEADLVDSANPIFQQTNTTARFPYAAGEYARRIIWEMVGNTLFRHSPRRAYGWRNFLLRRLGATIAGTAKVRRTCRIFHPWLLDLGEWSTIGDDVEVYNLGPVTIGRHSVVSHGAYLCAGTHDYTRPNLPLQRPPIHIGSGVWVCTQAFIGPGVSIGDNSIVGARAVVPKDVPAGVVVAGNPAKVIKNRPMGTPERLVLNAGPTPAPASNRNGEQSAQGGSPVAAEQPGQGHSVAGETLHAD